MVVPAALAVSVLVVLVVVEDRVGQVLEARVQPQNRESRLLLTTLRNATKRASTIQM